MESFSQKYGYKSLKTVIQIDSMDEELCNGLWNALYAYYWERVQSTFVEDDRTGVKDLLRHKIRPLFCAVLR